MSDVRTKATLCKQQTTYLAAVLEEQKNEALKQVAGALEEQKGHILAANEEDVQEGRAGGVSAALLDRLTLTEARLNEMAAGLMSLRELPDPIGAAIDGWQLENGLRVEKVRVPLGVIGMIYEARPNVTIDAFGLGLKTGNAMLLRGSSSAIQSNKALLAAIHTGLRRADLAEECIQLVEDTAREAVAEMLTLSELIDVIVPRGSAAFIQRVIAESRVPVLETGAGVCHTYIDRAADAAMAEQIVLNAKTDRPGVCNALETLLVHEEWAEVDDRLTTLLSTLASRGVTVRGCARTRAFAPNALAAEAADWDREYLDHILAVKIVADLDEAISHIDTHGTKHSECIVTDDIETAESFLRRVDAACVYHNASTRFTDGFQFGFGAEMGISTQKLHARGPMGLKELTSYKYVLRGTGQIRGGGVTSC